MKKKSTIAWLVSCGFCLSVSTAGAQQVDWPENVTLQAPGSAATTPVQKVAFDALNLESPDPQEPVQYSLNDRSQAPIKAQPASIVGSGSSARSGIIKSLDTNATTTRKSAPNRIISVQTPQDQDSTVDVPDAPAVDTQSDPTGRPLAVPSNAATMPDEYYRRSWCNLGDPVYFVDRPTLRIGGWDQVGWHTQDNGLFNNRKNELNLHQSWGFIEKDFVTAYGTNVKFRGDLMYGIDSHRLQAFGNEPFGAPQDWDNTWDNGSYGWALPQLYSEVEFQRATVRAGRFLSPFGFENAAPVENFFYSHTYAYTLTHPHTLSGAVVETCVNDTTSVFAGGTNGWDTDFDEVGFTGLGGFTKRLANGGLLTYGTSFGEFGQRGVGYFHSIVYAVQATEKVQLAMQSDWLDADLSEDWGVTGYGIYRFNPCLAAGTRLEYWETDPGVSKQQSALAWTSGLNYRPHANVVIRPEVRMDWNGAAVADGDLNLGIDFVLTY